MGAVVVVIALAVGLAAAAVMFSGGSPGRAELSQAIEYKTAARFDEAIALLESIPSDSALSATAQQELADVRQRKAAAEALRYDRTAGVLYDNIKGTEKNWVLGPGPSSASYAANARYLLKRCAEFLERFPDDSRAQEIGGFAYKYAKVASLDAPPDEADVDAELNFRLFSHDYSMAMAVIDEYAISDDADTTAVRRLRERVQTASLDYWKQLRQQLEKRGALNKGQENWQQVANACRRYLSTIEDVPGITPAIDAKALYARAVEG